MDPITREEMYLAAAAGYDVEPPEPITRKEVFLAKLAGMDVETPAPFTRRERFIEEAAMAESNAVIEPLQISENGTYTAPAGVDGYNPVTVNVDPTKITILREQEISGFALDEEFGYLVTDPEPTYTIMEGEKYYVVWDGVTYETTAQKADSFMPGALFMGNGTILGLPGNNEPFAIGYVNGMVLYTAFDDPKESHNIGIYQSAIKLQDITVTENGEYTAGEGFYGLGKVLVQLTSSGNAYKFKTDLVEPTSTTNFTAKHYCGVVPDILVILPTSATSANKFMLCFGLSKAAIENMQGGAKSFCPVYTGTAVMQYQDTNGIDSNEVNSYYADGGGIRNVTSSDFTFGGKNGQLRTDISYRYIAIYKAT